MRYEMKTGQEDVAVAMRGDLNFQDHPNVKKLLTELSEAGRKSWVFDLSGLKSIDSAGIGMLLIAKDEGDKAGAKITLRAPGGNVRRVLELTRIGDMMKIVA